MRAWLRLVCGCVKRPHTHDVAQVERSAQTLNPCSATMASNRANLAAGDVDAALAMLAEQQANGNAEVRIPITMDGMAPYDRAANVDTGWVGPGTSGPRGGTALAGHRAPRPLCTAGPAHCAHPPPPPLPRAPRIRGASDGWGAARAWRRVEAVHEVERVSWRGGARRGARPAATLTSPRPLFF